MTRWRSSPRAWSGSGISMASGSATLRGWKRRVCAGSPPPCPRSTRTCNSRAYRTALRGSFQTFGASGAGRTVGDRATVGAANSVGGSFTSRLLCKVGLRGLGVARAQVGDDALHDLLVEVDSVWLCILHLEINSVAFRRFLVGNSTTPAATVAAAGTRPALGPRALRTTTTASKTSTTTSPPPLCHLHHRSIRYRLIRLRCSQLPSLGTGLLRQTFTASPHVRSVFLSTCSCAVLLGGKVSPLPPTLVVGCKSTRQSSRSGATTRCSSRQLPIEPHVRAVFAVPATCSRT